MDAIQRYVINLESRADRRAEMERQLKSVGWDAQFSQSTRPEEAAGFPSIGARGCFLSHLQMLRRGATVGHHVLLMEDDLDFSPGFSDRWQKTIELLDHKNWSIFYAGHALTDLPNGLSTVDSAIAVQCAHFILFNRCVVHKVIDGLEKILNRQAGDPMGGPMHVDGAYSTIRKHHPSIETLIVSPPLGYQRPSRSDISDANWFDRISTLEPAVRTVRNIMSRNVQFRKLMQRLARATRK